jgi:hypothetical protein
MVSEPVRRDPLQKLFAAPLRPNVALCKSHRKPPIRLVGDLNPISKKKRIASVNAVAP